ncbi:flavin reductase [Cellvibrio zantedeschiae]|uniref:Flavin reductase n=1 Tax=Cellvibrio zantedeschiae TaxID=1237077 RepID=A0ABQ3B9B7_9GAMM|nr:flavin reductase family protein [Cellvibrio zantedeschiae]GGY85728.1 flavin reductase [Cellvibrio zantedeschiae]
MNFDPRLIEAAQCYKLMVGSITPRPIAWISSLSSTGVLNLAPYSFFTVASCNPPVLAVTQVNPRDRAAKDTLTNLRATGECVVNIVSEDQAAIMNASCGNYPPEISEFSALNIASEPSHSVKVAGVKAANVRFECKLREVLAVSSLPMGGHMMLLDVVSIYVNESVLVDGQIAPHLLNTIGKLGGDLYTATHEQFEMARPDVK